MEKFTCEISFSISVLHRGAIRHHLRFCIGYLLHFPPAPLYLILLTEFLRPPPRLSFSCNPSFDFVLSSFETFHHLRAFVTIKLYFLSCLCFVVDVSKIRHRRESFAWSWGTTRNIPFSKVTWHELDRMVYIPGRGRDFWLCCHV